MLITINKTATKKSSLYINPKMISNLDKNPLNGGIPAKEKNKKSNIIDHV